MSRNLSNLCIRQQQIDFATDMLTFLSNVISVKVSVFPDTGGADSPVSSNDTFSLDVSSNGQTLD